MIEFEWDASKAKSNLKKHGISFEEAKSVFYDEYATQFFDEAHSDGEDRFIMLGISNDSRIIVVVHCEREDTVVVRLISARKATKKELNFYKG